MFFAKSWSSQFCKQYTIATEPNKEATQKHERPNFDVIWRSLMNWITVAQGQLIF